MKTAGMKIVALVLVLMIGMMSFAFASAEEAAPIKWVAYTNESSKMASGDLSEQMADLGTLITLTSKVITFYEDGSYLYLTESNVYADWGNVILFNTTVAQQGTYEATEDEYGIVAELSDPTRVIFSGLNSEGDYHIVHADTDAMEDAEKEAFLEDYEGFTAELSLPEGTYVYTFTAE